jgi:cytosine/adenosine deaminase-related metal-dependent hydrolase
VLCLPGHFVTPGFVNTHAHFILSLVRGVAADLGFARVAHGDWRHSAAIGQATLQVGRNLHTRWAKHPRVRVNLARSSAPTCARAGVSSFSVQ